MRPPDEESSEGSRLTTERPTSREVILREASIGGRRVDVRWSAGRVLAIAAHSRQATPGSHAGDDRAVQVIECGGGEVLPGLHDHHIHLMALAAARRSVMTGPPAVTSRDELATVLAQAVRTADGGDVRGVGYHESVAGDLDADALEILVPSARQVPLRIQHRSGQMWVLNHRAIARAGIAGLSHDGIERSPGGAPTGRVFGADLVLRQRFGPSTLPDLHAIGQELASYGVTGVTDLTPTERIDELEDLARAVTNPSFPVRVTVTGALSLADRVVGGLPTQVGIGPVKILPLEHDLPHPDDLAASIERAHRAGRNVAIHCVSRVGLVIALVAFRAVGARPGDRIEHGSVIPRDVFDELHELGLLIVTQPNFVAERGDQYLADVPTDEQIDLWRCGSLDEAGIPVAGGTDAPFGHPDPWRAVTAAVERTTSSGALLGPDERVSPERALALFLGAADRPGRIRAVRVGELTDLCVLHDPLDHRDVSAARVRLTLGRAGPVAADVGQPAG